MVEPQRIARARTGEMRPCHGCWQHAAVQYILKRASEGGARASTASLCQSYCLLLCWVCRVWVCPSVLSRPQGGGAAPDPRCAKPKAKTNPPGPANSQRSPPAPLIRSAHFRMPCAWGHAQGPKGGRGSSSSQLLARCASSRPVLRRHPRAALRDALYHRCSSARPASAPTDLLSPSTCARQIAAARRERTSSGAARSLTFAIRHVYLDR